MEAQDEKDTQPRSRGKIMSETYPTVATIFYAAFDSKDPAQVAAMRVEGRQPVTRSAAIIVELPTPLSNACEAIFEATNLQHNDLWAKLEPTLPANRSHTSLSVGDVVQLSSPWAEGTYRVEAAGFAPLTNDERGALLRRWAACRLDDRRTAARARAYARKYGASS